MHSRLLATPWGTFYTLDNISKTRGTVKDRSKEDLNRLEGRSGNTTLTFTKTRAMMLFFLRTPRNSSSIRPMSTFHFPCYFNSSKLSQSWFSIFKFQSMWLKDKPSTIVVSLSKYKQRRKCYNLHMTSRHCNFYPLVVYHKKTLHLGEHLRR